MKKIPLNGKHGKGKFTLVDDEDYEELMKYKWYLSTLGYPVKHKMESGVYKITLLHRLIMNAKKGLVIDHINHNTLDNQKINLRECTHAQNMQNKISITGVSKFKGAYFNKDRKSKKWWSYIRYNNKKIFLGTFKTELEAAKAYNAKALELFGQFAHLNKI